MGKCIYPVYLPNREIPVPCRKCGNCLRNRKQDWQFRLKNELEYADSAYFVTLTYSDDYVPVQNGQDVLHKPDLQKFFKRLRKRHSSHSKSQIRYYAVGEYGTQFKRPHYHIILFNAVQQDVIDSWAAGFVKFDKVNMSSIGYVLGYVSSIDDESVSRGVPKQFAVMSRRPAIGYRYIQTHGHWHSSGLRNYTKIQGVGGRLPEYYKKKIFSKPQLEILTYKALKAYEDVYNALYYYYKNLNEPDPAFRIREQERFYDNRILENIKAIKLQI